MTINAKNIGMKKEIICIIMVLGMAVATHAQTNPQPGYIITNENDTIWGTIDYLSDFQNQRACLFKADGAQTYREYKPGDISGYRLSTSGIFYVTRTFVIGDAERAVFAEYLLQGGVSLYYARDVHTQYYFWVDEDGKTARMVYDGERSSLSSDDRQLRKSRIIEVSQLLGRSAEAQKRLWKTNYSASDLIDLTREYDETYCTDAGDCIQFKSDTKKRTGLKVRLRVEAGVDFNTVRNKHYTGENWIETSCTYPYFGIGADLNLPRFSRLLNLETLLKIDKKSGSHEEVDYLKKVTSMHFEYYDLELQLGLAVRFLPNSMVRPFVRGGLSVNEMLGIKTENMEHYKIGRHEQDFRTRLGMGYYVGIGADISVKGHTIRIAGNYVTHNNDDMAILTKSRAFSVGIGFCF